MGLRAAAMGRLVLDGVSVAGKLDADYAECVRLARLGWSALACGTSKAVLDYVIPYVNDRKAFGEPISHRQAVAFMVADIAHRTRRRAAGHAACGIARRAGHAPTPARSRSPAS